MSGSLNSIFGLGTTLIAVPPGATQAVLVTPVAGQIFTRIKYQSGGTLEIIGLGTAGATLTAAQLVSNSGGHYLVGNTEAPITLTGAPAFYLSSLSATTVVMVM